MLAEGRFHIQHLHGDQDHQNKRRRQEDAEEAQPDAEYELGREQHRRRHINRAFLNHRGDEVTLEALRDDVQDHHIQCQDGRIEQRDQ